MDISMHLPSWVIYTAGGIGIIIVAGLALFGVACLVNLSKMRW